MCKVKEIFIRVKREAMNKGALPGILIPNQQKGES